MANRTAVLTSAAQLPTLAWRPCADSLIELLVNSPVSFLDGNVSSTPSITESPWYWVHLFSAAGLVALVLLTPKFGPRQAQIEQNYQARQRAARAAAGQEPDTPLSTDARTLISLSPLYVGLAAVFFVSGVKIWRRRTTARFHSSQEVTTS